jgi:hypothetical protein
VATFNIRSLSKPLEALEFVQHRSRPFGAAEFAVLALGTRGGGATTGRDKGGVGTGITEVWVELLGRRGFGGARVEPAGGVDPATAGGLGLAAGTVGLAADFGAGGGGGCTVFALSDCSLAATFDKSIFVDDVGACWVEAGCAFEQGQIKYRRLSEKFP